MLVWQKPKENKAEMEGLWEWPVSAMQSNTNTNKLPEQSRAHDADAATTGRENNRSMRPTSSERSRQLREGPMILPFWEVRVRN